MIESKLLTLCAQRNHVQNEVANCDRKHNTSATRSSCFLFRHIIFNIHVIFTAIKLIRNTWQLLYTVPAALRSNHWTHKVPHTTMPRNFFLCSCFLAAFFFLSLVWRILQLVLFLLCCLLQHEKLAEILDANLIIMRMSCRKYL